MTKFEDIYKLFLGKITDDMYIYLEKWETISLLQELLINAIPHFTYPKFRIENFKATEPEFFDSTSKNKDGIVVIKREIEDKSYFEDSLSLKEKNIISELMVVEWLGQQLANRDITTQMYTGSDSRNSSPANHMDKLQKLQKYFTEKSEKSMFEYDNSFMDKDGYTISRFNELAETQEGGERNDEFYNFSRF